MKRFTICKILAVLVCAVMAFGVLAGAAFAADDWAGATRFVFTDDGITVSEGAYDGYKVKGTALTINGSGVYIVSGSCANGSIVVKKNVTDVTLVLDGLSLSAGATAPITCNKGSGVTIVAASGTVNDLADDALNNDDIYTDETLYPDIENAVIKCKDGSNVTICGTGTINVTANGKNGVKGGYDLYEEDADGNATDTLLSAASLTVRDVTLNITCNVNDGLKSDKELNLLSGSITVSAADDGIKSEYVLNIGAEGTDGPTILVKQSNEGIEAATLNVYSGQIRVNASDDGINAANGDLTNYKFSYNQYGGDVWVNVTNGDGVDSNGTINLMGGTLEVYSPAQGDGDPLDADGGTTFAGATVLAVGHNAMQQGYSGAYVAFGGTGGFGGRMGGMGNAANLVAAGGDITVKDADGNTLYSGEAVRNASYVVFASPDVTEGSAYTLYQGGSSVATATAATGNGGGMGPGGFPGGQQPAQPDDGTGTRPDAQRPDDGTFPGIGQPADGTFPEVPQPADDTASTVLRGDVNGDGTVNSADARLVLRAAAMLTELTDAQKAAADVNGDGVVNSADARILLRVAAQLQTLA